MSLMDQFHAFMEFWPPKTKYTSDDVPDLTGKVMLVTGGNTGIGKETARVLLAHNAKVYIGCRSPDKATAAVEDLKASTGKSDIHVVPMDLSNLPTIKTGVDEFLKQETRLDTLFNSAGVMLTPIDSVTSHNHDMQFGTNVLGHFYLTQLLLPLLIASAKTSTDQHARVVTYSSNGHWSAPTRANGGPIVYNTLVDGPERRKYPSITLYAQSKAGNVLFAHALARKYGSQGIVSTSLNPGGIASDLARHTSSWIESFLRLVLYPVSQGALTALYAGTSPEGVELNGKYLVPWARVKYNRQDLDVEEDQEKLWTWCEGEVKKYAP